MIPSDIKWDPNATPPQFTDNGDQVIEKGTHLRIKIMGTRSDVGSMFAIGSIKEDFLGLVKYLWSYRLPLTIWQDPVKALSPTRRSQRSHTARRYYREKKGDAPPWWSLRDDSTDQLETVIGEGRRLMRVAELGFLGVLINVLVVRMWPLRVSNPLIEVQMKRWQPFPYL